MDVFCYDRKKKSVVNKDKNNYYYNIFLEKVSYKDKSNAEYFLMNVCIL